MSQRPRIFSTGSIVFGTMVAVVVIGVLTTSANSVQSGRTAAANAFSGERALAYTAEVVAFGPRVSGSDAIEQTRLYIERTLQGFGYTVTREEFTARTPLGPVQMANLAVVVPAADGVPDGPAIMLAGHTTPNILSDSSSLAPTTPVQVRGFSSRSGASFPKTSHPGLSGWSFLMVRRPLSNGMIPMVAMAASTWPSVCRRRGSLTRSAR